MKSNLVVISVISLCFMACGGRQSGGSSGAEVVPNAPATPPAADATDAAGGEAGAVGAEQPPALSATKLGPQIGQGMVRFNFKPMGSPGKIYLAGEFNGWNPSNDDYLLKDEDGDGIYSITINLEPGTYQYQFVIDSRWTKDPNAPGSHPDGFGGQNGKFDVPAK